MLRTTPSLCCAALACASLGLAHPGAAATLVFSHAGCADPATAVPDPHLENWVLLGLVSPGAVGPACGDSGVDAWQISDPDPALAGPHYRHDASAVAGAAAGWTLRARLGVRDLADAVDASVVLEASAAGRRFRLRFGSDALGNTLVRRDGETANLIAQAPAFHVTGYHLYELAWDPSAGSAGEADLFVDGLPASPGWSGAASPDAQVLFGADDAAGTGAARFSDLAFETGAQACRNGIDDDGDGRTDLVAGDEDPGCDSPSDPSEKSVLRVCDDGLDNDGDGLVDRADPQCTSVAGRSERPGVSIQKTQADWLAAAGGGPPLAFDTSAANVGLATEIGATPAPGASPCGPPAGPVASCELHFAAVNTHLCRDFSLRAGEVGAGITFDDSAERSNSPAWQNALSIGDLGDYYNDDFEFRFGAGEPVHAFGFTFIDNQRKDVEGLYVYGPGDELIAVLPGPAAPVSDGNRAGFVGIVSSVPVTRVVFDEDPDGDELAIRDFRFGDPDPDADGLGDCAETGLGTDPDQADSDGDGLADGAEVGTHHTDPLLADSDEDGLSDGAEVLVHGTNPLAADSDGDHFDDGVEIAAGTDPNDPASFPATPVPSMGSFGRLLAAALVGLFGVRGGRRFRAARA